jgi:hypothetical protein
MRSLGWWPRIVGTCVDRSRPGSSFGLVCTPISFDGLVESLIVGPSEGAIEFFFRLEAQAIALSEVFRSFNESL